MNGKVGGGWGWEKGKREEREGARDGRRKEGGREGRKEGATGGEREKRTEGRKEGRREGQGKEVVKLKFLYLVRRLALLNTAHPCEVEGVVYVDESHGISGSFESIDLLMWVSN